MGSSGTDNTVIVEVTVGPLRPLSSPVVEP